MKTGAFFIMAIFWMCVSCHDGDMDSLQPANSDRLANGVWGGQHIGMEVTSSGATLDYDCAHGTIDEPIKVDARGNFSVRGSHTKEHPGPLIEGEETKSYPARYTGHTDGKEMTLTVKLTDKEETIGAFTLTYGKTPIVRKCL